MHIEHTAWKVSVFGVILVVFPPWIEYGEIRSKFQCGKMRTRIIPNTDTFYAVTSVQTLEKWKLLAVLKYLRLYIIMVIIYCYLKRENYKVFKFQVNNSSYVKISACLF